MSLQRTQAVACDVQGPGCAEVVATCSTSARVARAIAADEGWYRQGDADVCPACVAPSKMEKEATTG